MLNRFGSIAACLLLAGSAATAQTIPGAVLARREPHHHPAYEDAAMRVLRVHVAPRDSTLLHEHDRDYFWIALGPSEVVNAKLGAPDATIKSDDMSIHYTPGNFAHVARNPGGSSFDNITIELLRPQTNVRNLCETALGGQSQHCDDQKAKTMAFAGADGHAAFTTDQLQVSLATIAPGATLRPATAARMWIIALDTLDARAALVASGGGKWSGGVLQGNGRGWSVKNQGRQPKRVLAVTGLEGR